MIGMVISLSQRPQPDVVISCCTDQALSKAPQVRHAVDGPRVVVRQDIARAAGNQQAETA